MAGTAVNTSASKLIYKSASLSSGVSFTGTTLLGYLVEDGSEFGNPEVQAEDFFVGSATTGATWDATFRILGNAVDSSVASATAANPPTEVFLFLVNISETKYTEFKVRLVEGFVESASTNAKRTSWLLRATAKGDAVSDFMIYKEGTLTSVPS